MESWELGSKAECAEFLDLGICTWSLATELVAWEIKDGETLVPVCVIQFVKLGILGTAFTM